jgi:hypothetical protein
MDTLFRELQRGETCGHSFQFANLNRETFLPAMIVSYFGNLQALQDELRTMLL